MELVLDPGDQTVDFVWAFRSWKFLRYAAQSEWKYVNKADARDEMDVPGGLYGRTVVYPMNEPMLTPAANMRT